MTLEPSAAPAPGLHPAPLFILGPPRSGTTFLQQVVDSHPEVFVTDELRAVSWLVQEAGKLREGFSTHGNPYPITHGRVFADYLLANAGRILVPFYLRQAKRAGKPAIRYWGDKYPHYDEILHLLPRLLPEARFVLIHRDLRDTIASVMKGHHWPAERAAPYVCLIYDRYVRKAEELTREGTVPPARFLHVNYLDLNTDPSAQTERLFTALGLGFPEATTERVRELSGIQAHSIRRPGRAAQPFTIGESHQRWARDLTPADVRVVLEAISRIAEAVELGNRQQPGAPFSYPAP